MLAGHLSAKRQVPSGVDAEPEVRMSTDPAKSVGRIEAKRDPPHVIPCDKRIRRIRLRVSNLRELRMTGYRTSQLPGHIARE
jgi:hypothetical protein